MQIYVKGYGEKDFASDRVVASATFGFRAGSYDEALKGGVEKVKHYIDTVTEMTDFEADDFRTRAYSVKERFHINKIDPKTEADLDKNLQRRVSDGFFFTQFMSVKFDYDKKRLAELLAISAKIPGAPMLHIDFALKDLEAKRRELIPIAFEDAKMKAEVLASAAGKDLGDCVRVEIDTSMCSGVEQTRMLKSANFEGAFAEELEQQIQNIDETFRPDDITLSKVVSCVWETCDGGLS